MTNKIGAKISVCIYNNLRDSKLYAPFMSSYPGHCLIHIPFSLIREILTIVENENGKGKRFKELKKNIIRTTNNLSHWYRVVDSELKKIIPWTFKATKNYQNWGGYTFTMTYNLRSPNVFLLVKEIFDNFQYSKTMTNICQKKKPIKSMNQTPNLGMFFCMSKLEWQQENQKVENCGKSWLSCPFLLASLYHFRRVNKTFILKNSMNCQSSNLIYFGIFQGCNKKAAAVSLALS